MALSWTSFEAANPKRFFNAKVVLMSFLVLVTRCGEDLWLPHKGVFAGLTMLDHSRVSPFAILFSISMFCGADAERARGLAHIGFLAAPEIVNAFLLHLVSSGSVFGAEDAGEFMTTFEKCVASCFFDNPF